MTKKAAPAKKKGGTGWLGIHNSVLFSFFFTYFLLFFIKISVSNVTIDVTVDVERWQLCTFSSHKPFWNLKITVFYRAPVQKLLLGWQL